MASGFDHKNPYASPREVGTRTERVLTREEALRLLRKPAIGLLVVSTGSILYGFGVVAVVAVQGLPPEANTREGFIFMASMALLIFWLLPTATLVSAAQVFRKRPRGWIWLAIVAGLIPLGSPCTCVGVPFAFWLLHLMLRKDIRAALATPEAAR